MSRGHLPDNSNFCKNDNHRYSSLPPHHASSTFSVCLVNLPLLEFSFPLTLQVGAWSLWRTSPRFYAFLSLSTTRQPHSRFLFLLKSFWQYSFDNSVDLKLSFLLGRLGNLPVVLKKVESCSSLCGTWPGCLGLGGWASTHKTGRNPQAHRAAWCTAVGL